MTRIPPSVRRQASALRSILARHSTLLLALLAGAIVYLTATGLFPYHSANHDEGVYLQQAAMLLDGTLTLHPPVEDAFRPWFFVEDGDTLYPKYAPVPATIFAIGLLLDQPRLSLALVGAVIVGLTALVGRELFDQRTGLLAGALLLTSPLFVLDSAVFLPYAPTTALALGFAYAYLRAERLSAEPPAEHAEARRTMGAAIAGACIGLAFFARPYTSVLFALPFIAHALWSLAQTAPGSRSPVVRRRLATVTIGSLGVLLALAYNWTLTGHPLVFPYEAFAPLDGIGFGRREILGHSIDYTPRLALQANALVLTAYATQWAPLGILGTLLAGLGLAATRGRWRWRHAAIAGLFLTVPLGNLAFWGNYNILGNLDVAGDGLISLLGPYYHFDLLVPTTIFAAHGIRWLAGRVGDVVVTRTSRARPLLALLLVVAVIVAGASTASAFSGPVDRNATATAEYDAAYDPFQPAPPPDAVVFLPEPYGPWLNHPFQYLRNDPGFDGETVYALATNEFAVTDAYPDRDYYRYVYRGTWYPFDEASPTPALQPVERVAGDRVSATIRFDVPDSATSTSMRLESSEGYAFYSASATAPTQSLTLSLDRTHARIEGPGIEPTGQGDLPLDGSDDLVLEVNVNTEGGGFSYHIVVPTATVDGERAALTPTLEVCTVPRLCGGEAAYIPGSGGSRYDINVTMHGN